MTKGDNRHCSVCQRGLEAEESAMRVSGPEGRQAEICWRCERPVEAWRATHGGTEWEAVEAMLDRLRKTILGGGDDD